MDRYVSLNGLRHRGTNAARSNLPSGLRLSLCFRLAPICIGENAAAPLVIDRKGSGFVSNLSNSTCRQV